jgi:hypothetical protein
MNKNVALANPPVPPAMVDNRPWYKKVKRNTWIKTGLIFVATLFVGGIIEFQIVNHRGVYRFSKFILVIIRTTSNKGDTTGFGILWIASVVIGVLAYLLRQNIRDLYGIVEILIGSLATAWTAYTLSKTTGHADAILLSQGLALSGGIYIVVRGVDNFVSDIKRTNSRKSAAEDVGGLNARLSEAERKLEQLRIELQAELPAPPTSS